jgi:hypothetical protein
VRVLRPVTVVVVALGVRFARSRDRRLLHPDGRSFSGELEVWGSHPPVGSDLLDRRAVHPITVRLSKGMGTRRGRPDVLGLAIRVHGTEQDMDLLLSTAGTGAWTRHIPVPRRTFDTWYGSITSYRTGEHHKIYLAAGADPDGRPLGRTLESVVATARLGQGRLLLSAGHGGDTHPFGRISFGPALPAPTDAALAFDPVRNSGPDLHPSGTVHGIRAAAYRFSQRWRGVTPPAADARAVVRTTAHR